jgi:methyltransferase (TIGR00027 family)
MTTEEPESTAARVALWRARHVEADAPPPVLDDGIGLALLAPDDDWRSRPDMAEWTKGFRAAIAARARFVEDLVLEQLDRGVAQYVLLGAGLDTFVQRRPELGDRLRVFEIDQPGPQAWKRRRLVELGFGVPVGLTFVPVDFEAADDWYARLVDAGFDATVPAVIAATGLSMYLTTEATRELLATVAGTARGTTFVMTFMLPGELLDPADRPGFEAASEGARRSGTPFIGLYAPEAMLALASDAGFSSVRHVSGPSLGDRYFSDRTDGLRPSSGEDLLVATV